MRYAPRLERAEIEEAARHTHALWGSGRSLAEHTAHTLEQLDRAGPELLRYVGLFDGAELVASIKRYGMLLRARVGERPLRAVGIGAVFTQPAARSRGAASALVAAVLGEARDLGYEAAFLYSDIAPAYYERLGFVSLSSVEHRAATDALPREGALAVRAAGPEDLDRLIAFYEESFLVAGDLLCPARTRALWRYFRWRSRIRGEYILSDEGRDVGYLVAALDDPLRDLPEDREPGLFWIDEWSAPGVADERVFATVRALAEREGAATIGAWLRPEQAQAPFVERPRTSALAMIAPLTPDLVLDPPHAFLSSFEHF